MKNAQKLKDAMQLGRVYRRQDLDGLTTAVDRDLKTLVESGEVRKLGYGLYYRPRKNSFGDTPPDERELVRAFLKTDDFLLTSYNYFNQLGLGLTQLYNNHVVYNHKRSGNFLLGGQRFRFRVVPAYPKKLSKEYLLVDLLNNLKQLPDNAELVLQSLKYRLPEFDHGRVSENLARYGKPAARELLRTVRGAGILREEMKALKDRSHWPVRIVPLHHDSTAEDLAYWLSRPPEERVAAVEFLSEQGWVIQGFKKIPRLVREISFRDVQH